MGVIADSRNYKHNYYGGYCNKVRNLNLNPMPYHKFSDIINNLLQKDLTKKQIMQKLIDYTSKNIP